MARVIGKSTVLPDAPYQPNMASLPQVSLTRDTLSAHNAMGQSLTQASPRPAPTMVNTPKFTVPQGQGLTLNEMLMGGGFGQGIVANSPRPAANFVPSTPSLDVSALAAARAADFELEAYKMMNTATSRSTTDTNMRNSRPIKPTSPVVRAAPDIAPMVPPTPINP